MARKPRRTLSAALAREGEVAEPQTPGKQPALPEATPAPGAPETVRYTAYLPRPVYRQLKELAFTHDRKWFHVIFSKRLKPLQIVMGLSSNNYGRHSIN